MSKKESKGLVTKESICATGGLFAVLALFILCTRSLIFGGFGAAVHAFLTGVFGLCAYPVLAGIVYLCVMGLFGKRLVKDRWLGAMIIVTCCVLALVIHTATTFNWSLDGYLTSCFKSGESVSTITVAGWVGGLFVFALSKLITQLGALLVFIFLTLVLIYACVRVAKRTKKDKTVQEKTDKKATAPTVKSVEIPLSQSTAAQNGATQAQQPQSNVQQVQVAYPYANTVTQQAVNTPTQAAVPQAEGQPTQAVYSGPAEPMVTQRPGVSLSETGATPAQTQQATTQQPAGPTSFSPFGNAQTMPISDPIRSVAATIPPAIGQEEQSAENHEYDYSNPRDFLFGSSPAENYRRNLLFDPNARVNNMPITEQPNAVGGTSGYMPSYADAYQNSVNQNTQPSRSAGSFDNFTSNSAFANLSERREESATFPTSISPMSTFEEEPRRAESSPYSLFGGSDSRGETVEDRGARDDNNFGREETSFGREENFTAAREEGNGYSRHNYMDLFSPSNPNVFGRDESERGNHVEEFEREESRFNTAFESREVDRGREIENVEEPTRDGYNLLDDDNPYSLRSDFSADRNTDSERRFEIDNSREEHVVETPHIGFEEHAVEVPRIGFGRDERTEEEIYVSQREPIVEQREEVSALSVAPSEPPKPIETLAVVEQPKPVPQPPKPRIIRPYVRVRLDDLDCRDIEPTSNFEEVEETKQIIIETLEDFKISGASIASVTFGPTVARYNVTLPRSISPKKVVALDQSIAISLRSNGVNVYPNYEDGVVSIEVPNKERQFVQLGCMLSGDTFVNAKSSSLMFAMGKDVANRKVYGDISKMIHLLVAGSSGSGKSVFLGSLIISLIYKYSPEELRLILIDPKKTEFVLYNDLPHLMINEIITDANKAVQSLNWAIMEMNRRYGLFEQMSRSGSYVVNLDQYNAQVEKNNHLPKIVIIIDELADLMLAAKKEMEDRIQNLTQKARAAGIHLIVATQRPSTDVITGVIKSNLATRVAFYVATDVDSRVILDQTGAQKLLGKGDLLYTMPGVAAPIRVQSAFISTEESQRVVNFIKANNEAYYDEEATNYINSRGGYAGGDEPSSGGAGKDGDSVDPIYIEALRHVIACGSASISMIQRKCAAGYSRAGKIVEWMEDMGYISAFDGAKARKVLITKEEFESKYGPLDN